MTRSRYDYLDEIGKKFGRLTVIDKAEPPKEAKDKGMWLLCRCDCGKEVVTRRHNITSGGTKSCGCYSLERKRKEMIGEKFGKLTVVEFDKAVGGHVKWLCKCECGNFHSVSGHMLREGTVKSCGCLLRNPPGISAFNKLMDAYKRNAVNRGFSWNLTNEEAKEIMSKDCYYCAKPPSNVSRGHKGMGDYVYNGIDRVDNTKGYELENCVPCCGICNIAKRDMSVDEFREFITNVYHHWVIPSLS